MTADTPTRCEPPPELRGVDGWHWVQHNDRPPVIARWDGKIWLNTRMPLSTVVCAKNGWRYLAPVATPAEVAALRAEVARLTAERDADA